MVQRATAQPNSSLKTVLLSGNKTSFRERKLQGALAESLDSRLYDRYHSEKENVMYHKKASPRHAPPL